MLLANCTDGVLVMLAFVSSGLAAPEQTACGVLKQAKGLTHAFEFHTKHSQHGFYVEGRCKMTRKCLLHTFRSQDKT
jgi:hypothetical protein